MTSAVLYTAEQEDKNLALEPYSGSIMPWKSKAKNRWKHLWYQEPIEIQFRRRRNRQYKV